MTRCKDCDRDMEEDHEGKLRCFACEPGTGREGASWSYYVDGVVEHFMSQERWHDTREGLKRPVKP
jgi:hypothetical protein